MTSRKNPHLLTLDDNLSFSNLFFSFVWSYLPLKMFLKRFWPNKINNRGNNNNVNSIK